MKKVLALGGAGFVGATLVRRPPSIHVPISTGKRKRMYPS